VTPLYGSGSRDATVDTMFNSKKTILFLSLGAIGTDAFAALDGLTADGLIFVLVAVVVVGWLVLMLLAVSAKIVEQFVLKITNSRALANTSGLIAVVVLLLVAIGFYKYALYKEKTNSEKAFQLSQRQSNVRKAACEYDKEQLEAAIVQYVANREDTESGFSAIAQECAKGKNALEIFRRLLFADSGIYSWRTAKIPDEKYCPWIQMAFDAQDRNFVQAIRQENLTLLCSKKGKISHPWLGALLNEPKSTPESKIEWIEFLVAQGIDVRARGWYSNSYQDINLIDVAAKLADPKMTRYAIGLGFKTDDWVETSKESEGRLSALHWWVLTKRSYDCHQSNQTSEMDVLLRPLNSNEINLRISISGKKGRFFENYLSRDRHFEISPSCYGLKLKEIFGLNPILDDIGLHNEYGILDPWMEWHYSIGEALDLLSAEQVQKIVQPIPFSKPVHKRGSGALDKGGGMSRYIEGRGIKILE
jgi:hypothetical protein